MEPAAHPEVLARDWLPPIVVGRSREVAEAVRKLDPPTPCPPSPWVIAVAGPTGSGTSTVARRAAREVADRIRASVPGAPPRVLAVRTAFLRGTHGVVTAMLQRLQEGFDGRGFPVLEILAGLLRRLRREGRTTVLVLDDVAMAGPDLSPILRAFADPDRFLPEGESGLPPIFIILAGTTEALDAVARNSGPRLRLAPFVSVAGYGVQDLRSIVVDRCTRALGHPISGSTVDRLVARAVEEGGGAARVLELLRRELLGVTIREMRSGDVASRLRGVSIEPSVLRAIGEAAQSRPARLGEVRRLEAELARAEGARPLPTTTLWRRIVQLEQVGYVRREIRTGGSGGTVSLLRVLTPVDEWVTTNHRPGSRPGCERWDGSGSGEARPAEASALLPVGSVAAPNGL